MVKNYRKRQSRQFQNVQIKPSESADELARYFEESKRVRQSDQSSNRSPPFVVSSQQSMDCNSSDCVDFDSIAVDRHDDIDFEQRIEANVQESQIDGDEEAVRVEILVLDNH